MSFTLCVDLVLRLLFIFGMAIVTEVCYTCYAYYVSKVDLLRAPVASGLIAIGKAILVIAYVREPLMVAALALGQCIGTWLTLKIIQRQKG